MKINGINKTLEDEAIGIRALSTLSMFPNLMYQYNFDLFLIQFVAEIREREDR